MTALATFGGVVGTGLLMVLSSIFNGYALSMLWGWFIVPTFGAPALGIVQASGIALTVGYLTHQTNEGESKKKDDDDNSVGAKNEGESKKKDDDDNSVGAKVAKIVTLTLERPAFALFFGWIIHLFM